VKVRAISTTEGNIADLKDMEIHMAIERVARKENSQLENTTDMSILIIRS
jgi:hypothetical protein